MHQAQTGVHRGGGGGVTPSRDPEHAPLGLGESRPQCRTNLTNERTNKNRAQATGRTPLPTRPRVSPPSLPAPFGGPRPKVTVGHLYRLFEDLNITQPPNEGVAQKGKPPLPRVCTGSIPSQPTRSSCTCQVDMERTANSTRVLFFCFFLLLRAARTRRV